MKLCGKPGFPVGYHPTNHGRAAQFPMTTSNNSGVIKYLLAQPDFQITNNREIALFHDLITLPPEHSIPNGRSIFVFHRH